MIFKIWQCLEHKGRIQVKVIRFDLVCQTCWMDPVTGATPQQDAYDSACTSELLRCWRDGPIPSSFFLEHDGRFKTRLWWEVAADGTKGCWFAESSANETIPQLWSVWSR